MTNRNPLYIIGAGGFAREVYEYLSHSTSEVIGFLDDNVEALVNYDYKDQVVDRLFSDDLPKNAVLVMAIAKPSLKKQLYSFYSSKGYKFKTFVHPTAVVGSNVSIGEGSIICPQVTITTDVSIGVLATINAHSSIGHDAKLGDYCTLSGHCDVTGHVSLADEVYFGSHALAIPSVKIGAGAIIGAGSVVISKVKPGATMFGNPARKIK